MISVSIFSILLFPFKNDFVASFSPIPCVSKPDIDGGQLILFAAPSSFSHWSGHSVLLIPPNVRLVDLFKL
jgi:hypothetical protein